MTYNSNSGTLFSRYMAGLANFDAVRSYSNPAIREGDVIHVAGKATLGDTLGGTFVLSFSDLEADNANTVLVSTGLPGGRWIRASGLDTTTANTVANVAALQANCGNLFANSAAQQASIVTEQTVRANAIAALASRTTTLEANTTSLAAQIVTADTAIVSLQSNGSAQASMTSNLSVTAGALTANVTSIQGAIATLNGKAQAWLNLSTSVGNSTATVSLAANTTASTINFLANSISLSNGGSPIPALTVVGGNAFFSGKLAANAIDVGTLNANTIVANSITTPLVANGAISTTTSLTSTSIYAGAGSGAPSTIFTYTLSLSDPANLVVWAYGKQGYTSLSGSKPWQLMVNLDGAQLNYAGGGSAYEDAVSCIAAQNSVAAGSHSITVTWYGDSTMQIANCVAVIQALKK